MGDHRAQCECVTLLPLVALSNTDFSKSLFYYFIKYVPGTYGECIQSPRTGVTDSCELSHVGAGH